MHQVGNCSLGDCDSQLEQLAMNPWCSPEWVGLRHLKNKVTDLRADRRSPGTFESGLELPKQLETLFMPPNDSFGFDDDQSLLPVSPYSSKQDPEETIPVVKSWSFGRPVQNGQLLTKRKIFQRQIGCLAKSEK